MGREKLNSTFRGHDRKTLIERVHEVTKRTGSVTEKFWRTLTVEAEILTES